MTPFSFQIDRSATRTFIRYSLSQTMTARPQAKTVIGQHSRQKKNKKLFLSCSPVSLKSQFQCVYPVHKQACAWPRLYVLVCVFKSWCVPAVCVCVCITLPEKMEKALSFSQKIIGPQSNYEWLTHEVKSQD